MLREFRRVSQTTEGHRRLFTDDTFDLYVWYPRRWGAVIGFQLCYDKYTTPHTLTWRADGGYAHHRVDDGDYGSGGPKRSPILVADGRFDTPTVAARFQEAAPRMPRSLARFIHRRILECNLSADDD